ncbi:MAG TPA: DinB family protein [Acidimicrobiales bacterium]|jgi:uncharacterized damage-inducible protein DinB
MDSEKAVLLSALGNQRAHVLGALEGLSDAQLRQAVLPTGWSCLGLVQHLTLDVERFWFIDVFAGDGELGRIDQRGDDPALAWKVGEEVAAESVLEGYRRTVERATAVIEGSSLDAAPSSWPEFFGAWRLENLREIVVHVICETAIHAGHVDVVRELLDGTTWLILTEDEASG